MLKVNEKEFIKSYKQYKKDIRLIKILLKDKWYRTKWCKKHSIETLTDEELEKDLKRHQEEKMILERFILFSRFSSSPDESCHPRFPVAQSEESASFPIR